MRAPYLLLAALVASILLACPSAPPAEEDAGSSLGPATLVSDAGLDFPIRSAVVTLGTREAIYLFESENGRADFCSGHPHTERRLAITTSLDWTPGGVYPIGSQTEVRLEAENGYAFSATTGELSLSEGGPPPSSLSGSFSVAGFRAGFPPDFTNEVPGFLGGTFEAVKCESRPYFDGGTDVNRASGTLGFGVSSAVADHVGRYWGVWLYSRLDGSAGCAQREPVDAESLWFGFDRELDDTSPQRTFTTPNLQVTRKRIEADGGETVIADEIYDGQLEVTFREDGVSGMYALKMVGVNGAIEDVSGAFDAPICP